MKKIVALLLTGALLLMSACAYPAASPAVSDDAQKSPNKSETKVNEVLSAPVSDWSVADSIIAYKKCYDDITKINERLRSVCFEIADGIDDDSFVYSPISAYIALNAVAEGADDSLSEQIYSVLAPDGMTMERFRECIKAELENLTIQNGEMSDRLDISTIALLSDKYNYNEDYKKILGDTYDAALGRGDLSSNDMMQRINSWASETTDGVINPLLNDPLDETTDFAVLNSVYFLGEWSDRFYEEGNEQGAFHGLNGDSEVTFMQKFDAESAYAKCDDYASLVLPYKSGAVMRVYLPEEGRTARDVMNILSKGDSAEYGKALVTMKLPKFELQNDLDLKDNLTGTGLEVLCDTASGPLSKITPDGDMYLSALIQKASIKVDEKGTVAAATTMATANMCAAELDMPRVEFIVDRPFVYTIEKGGAVLFLGVMNDIA